MTPQPFPPDQIKSLPTTIGIEEGRGGSKGNNVPRIETIDGIGLDYLRWTKDMILQQQTRIEALEARIQRLDTRGLIQELSEV